MKQTKHSTVTQLEVRGLKQKPFQNFQTYRACNKLLHRKKSKLKTVEKVYLKRQNSTQKISQCKMNHRMN